MANFIDKDKNHFQYGVNEWTGEANKPVFYTKEMAKKKIIPQQIRRC